MESAEIGCFHPDPLNLLGNAIVGSESPDKNTIVAQRGCAAFLFYFAEGMKKL